MRIEIITAGGEILSGRTLDTNFRFLARALTTLGAPPIWHTTVPDSRELLADAVRTSIQRSDGVILTGGLGGTPDDITRRVLSQVLDRQLVLREEVLRAVEERYRALGRSLAPAAQSLALIPQGARLIANPVGLAPGLLLTTPRGGWLCALPGVPQEMRAMAEQFVLPFVERRLGGTRGWERVLRTAGVSETILAARIGLNHPPGCEVAYLPGWGCVDLRLIRRPDAAVGRPEYDRWVEELRNRLSPVVYGEGETSLEQEVGDQLVRRGLTVAGAESITGGGIGAALTRVPGSSRYFLGSVVAYSDEAKQTVLGVGRGTLINHGAVSEQTAKAMAHGARRVFGADLAVSATGIAGPGGGSPEKPVGTVWFGLSTDRGDEGLLRRFPPTSREATAGRAVFTALLVLHRHLVGVPISDPPWIDRPEVGRSGPVVRGPQSRSRDGQAPARPGDPPGRKGR